MWSPKRPGSSLPASGLLALALYPGACWANRSATPGFSAKRPQHLTNTRAVIQPFMSSNLGIFALFVRMKHPASQEVGRFPAGGIQSHSQVKVKLFYDLNPWKKRQRPKGNTLGLCWFIQVLRTVLGLSDIKRSPATVAGKLQPHREDCLMANGRQASNNSHRGRPLEQGAMKGPWPTVRLPPCSGFGTPPGWGLPWPRLWPQGARFSL